MKGTIYVQKFSDAVQCKNPNKRVTAYQIGDDIGIEFLHFNSQDEFKMMRYKKHCTKFGKNLHVNTTKLTRSTAEMLIVALNDYLEILNKKSL